MEVLDADRRLIEPYSLEKAVPVRVDSTRHCVEWTGASDLSRLANSPVRFRFHLTNGSLYAFWVSTSKSGASNGYVAAGGPGLSGPIDTLGGQSNA